MGFKVASRVRGLSDEAFREAFGTEEQCRAALVRLRWPGGFVCPCCGHREHCGCSAMSGQAINATACKKQTSTHDVGHRSSDTATKLPLTLWFGRIHLEIVTGEERHLVGGTLGTPSTGSSIARRPCPGSKHKIDER